MGKLAKCIIVITDSTQTEDFMKKAFITLLLVGFLFLVTAGTAFAFDDDWLNLVTFENLTRQTIQFIFLSPGDSDYWGPEILGSERVLEPGDELGFYILYPDECNTFDIMAIGEDGGTIFLWDYQICDGEEELIEFVRKDLSDDAPELEYVTIHIQNDTIPVWYIFISPSDSSYYGVDYLDETTILETDDTVSFLFPLAEGTAEFDLIAVDEDGDEYQFSFEIDEYSDGDLYAIEISDLMLD